MEKKKNNRFGRVVILSILTLVVLTGLVSCGTWNSTKVEDEMGRYSFRASSDLEIRPTESGMHHYYLEENSIHAWFSAKPAPTIDEGLSATFAGAGLDFPSYELGGNAGFGSWNLRVYQAQDGGNPVAVAFQRREKVTYSLLVRSENPDIDPTTPPLPVMRILTSCKFTEKAGELQAFRSMEEIEGFVSSIAAEKGGSISIAILQKDELVYTYAAGLAGPGRAASSETLYHWGSISKLMTATAVMQLVDEGSLELTTQVRTIVPELPTIYDDLELRHLLTHTSGFPDAEVTHLIGTKDVPLPDLVPILNDYIDDGMPMIHGIGDSHDYNNWNFLILGIIVERLSGEAITDYIESQIIAPLNLTDTHYDFREVRGDEAASTVSRDYFDQLDRTLAAGNVSAEMLVAESTDSYLYFDSYNIVPAWAGVRSTPSDAVEFANMYLNKGEGPQGSILDRSTAKDMLKARKTNSGDPTGTGLAWMLGSGDNGKFAEHGGSVEGGQTLLRIYPGKDLAIAVMANFSDYNPSFIMDAAVPLILKKDGIK